MESVIVVGDAKNLLMSTHCFFACFLGGIVKVNVWWTCVRSHDQNGLLIIILWIIMNNYKLSCTHWRLQDIRNGTQWCALSQMCANLAYQKPWTRCRNDITLSNWFLLAKKGHNIHCRLSGFQSILYWGYLVATKVNNQFYNLVEIAKRHPSLVPVLFVLLLLSVLIAASKNLKNNISSTAITVWTRACLKYL